MFNKNQVLKFILLSLLLQIIVSEAQQSVSLTKFNIIYKKDSKSVSKNLQSKNLNILFSTEEKVENTEFTFQWTFESQEDRDNGEQLFETLKGDFDQDGTSSDDSFFFINFTGADFKELVRYRRGEFGDIYEISLDQKTTSNVHFQFVAKKTDPNLDNFYQLIQKLVDNKKLKGSQLQVTVNKFNILYTKDSQKVTQNLQYKNMFIQYQTFDDTKIDTTWFKFVWVFGDDTEKTRGNDIATSFKNDFDQEGTDESDKLLYISFWANDIKQLVRYRRSEFGDIYELAIDQKSTSNIHFQFVVLKTDVYLDLFYQVIQAIVNSHVPEVENAGLKFLSDK